MTMMGATPMISEDGNHEAARAADDVSDEDRFEDRLPDIFAKGWQGA
jgi:hypothetical protein